MSTVELKKQLIAKIQKTKDTKVLEEAYRLLTLAAEDMEPYKLSDDQKKAIQEARQQVIKGQVLTNKQSNKEIDEWLKK